MGGKNSDGETEGYNICQDLQKFSSTVEERLAMVCIVPLLVVYR